MKSWKEYIEELKNEWVGKKVVFEGAVYTVVDVDYNGVLMINKKGKYTETTAAFTPEHAVLAKSEDKNMNDWNNMSAGEILDAVEEAWNKMPEDTRSYIELDWKMRQAELLVRELDIVTAVSEYIDAVGWDANPDNAYKCSECPHRNEGSWNSERPCGCLKCWVTQTCHTWHGRDDI